ncbi:MAG TPA: glycosyltransferase family 4 protein [Chloroflexi bacterium]|jgi:1,2-diacylglycerol 3-alpha-glucosyltransferase|nr:glycosyltransferase family 4 protein [Chloroflexota bacterium]
MRILVASHGYPPTVSGVTIVAQKLARAMVARGHDVAVITASERKEAYSDEDGGVRLIRVRSRNNPFWAEGPIPYISYNELEEIVDNFRPDVLHTHETALLALQFTRYCQQNGLPLLASCHYVPRFVVRYLSGDTAADSGPIESLVWAYSIWLLNRCDHVVFATPTHRRFFLEQGLKTPTTIISNGVDTSRYKPLNGQDEDIERRYDLPVGPRALFVGRLAKDKKIDVLIRAMNHIPAELNVYLLLVGRGDDRKRLEELCDDLGLQDRVRFLGFVPEEDMPGLFRVADLFVISSTYEVQSLPTLQAMATGLPVVAANALALPELVSDGVSGHLVPPDDAYAMGQAMSCVLSDRHLAERMGQAGWAVSQAHAEQRTFDAYEALYCDLMGR